MEVYQTKAKWSKELGEEIQSYTFAKKVYLSREEANQEELEVIQKLEDFLSKMEHTKVEEFVSQNEIQTWNETIDFTIRAVTYQKFGEKIHILNCVLLVLSKEEKAFTEFSKKFTNQTKVDKMEM